MKRAALYVRVSTQEQKKHGMSVDSQIVALEEYCKNNGFEIAGLYNDAGISARKTYKRRPALLQLMKDCEAGKIDIVLFNDLDRWFRSVADYYEVQRVLDKANVPWKSITEDYETETSSGIFKVNIMLSVAQNESDKKRDRARNINKYRRANGQYTSGKAPTGYISKNSALIKDESKKEAVGKMFETFLETGSTSKAHKAMLDSGVTIARETVSRMLRNQSYYGNAGAHKCEPYISKEDWDKIQYILGTRKSRTPKDVKKVYMFAGLVKCAYCGCGYHSHTRTMAHGKYTSKYYVCGRKLNGLCEKGFSITEKKLERMLIAELEPALSNYRANIQINDHKENDYEKKKKQLETRISRIGDRYEIGELSREDYIKKVKELKQELSLIVPESKKEPPELPSDWLTMYNALSEENKKKFWGSILKNVIISDDGLELNF